MKTRYLSLWAVFILSTSAVVAETSDTPSRRDSARHDARGHRQAETREASLPAPNARSEAPPEEPDPEVRNLDRDKRKPVDLEPGTEDDPDLPPGLPLRIDKADYLWRRARMVNRLRGFPNDLPYNGRVKALLELAPKSESKVGRTASQSFGAPAPLISTLGWTSIGPAPIPNGQTVGVGAPVSGRVSAVAVHPTNPDIAYVGTGNGGVYRTLDGGNTWTQLFDNAFTLAVGAIAISPSSPTTVFVGTGNGWDGCDSFGIGLYRITNAETTATLEGPFGKDGAGIDVLNGRGITQLLVNPSDGNTIFVSTDLGGSNIGCYFVAGASRGIYRSTNALSTSPTFTKLNVATANTGNRSVHDMVLEPGNPNNLICSVRGTGVAGDGGIYRSTNALSTTPTFTQELILGTTTGFVVAKLAINKVGSVVTVVAATAEPGSGSCAAAGQDGQLRISSDGGVTWSLPLAAANGFCGGQCYFDMAPAIDPNNASIIYLGGQNDSACSHVLIKSIDGGATFTPFDTGLHADVHAVVAAPSNPSIIYCGNDGGIWRSVTSGSSWTSLNNAGFNATQFQSLALHPTDGNFMIGGTQDNGTECLGTCGTNANPSSWVLADYGDGGFSLIDQNATDTTSVRMYHTYFNRSNTLIGFVTTTSSAAAKPNFWTEYGCGFTNANGINCTDDVLFFAPMALGPGNPNTLYFGTDRLYRSIDGGVTMTVISQAPVVATQRISAIGISPQNDSVRIIGLENGKVFATTTGSTTLTDVTPPSMPGFYVARAVIDPRDSNTAYLTLAGYGLPVGTHIWKTTNLAGGASTWTPLSGFPYDIPVDAFVIDPADSNDLFIGDDVGVFRSQDGGTTWTDFNVGLPFVPVFDMAIHPRTRALRIATYGRGVWERTVCQNIVVNPSILGNGTVGATYSQTLTAAGAIGSTTFSTSGTVPPGLVLSAAGVLTGTPTAGGSFNFTATATDSNGCAGSRAFTLVIDRATTTTTVASSANPSLSGSTVTFTATVTSGATGSVTIKDGPSVLGTAALSGTTATFTTSALALGSHAITAVYAGDSNYAGSTSGVLTQTVNAPFGPPPGVTAAASSQTSVAVSWFATANTVGYEIARSGGGAPFSVVGSSATNSFNDATAAPNAAYLYKVRAIDASGNRSTFSNGDLATTVIFTDNPIVPGTTVVKAAHLTELRTAVTAVCSLAGQPAPAFSDPNLNGSIFIKAVHVSELRNALDGARVVLGLPALSYTDPALAAGATVRAAHWQQLRTGVQ